MKYRLAITPLLAIPHLIYVRILAPKPLVARDVHQLRRCDVSCPSNNNTDMEASMETVTYVADDDDGGVLPATEQREEAAEVVDPDELDEEETEGGKKRLKRKNKKASDVTTQEFPE